MVSVTSPQKSISNAWPTAVPKCGRGWIFVTAQLVLHVAHDCAQNVCSGDAAPQIRRRGNGKSQTGKRSAEQSSSSAGAALALEPSAPKRARGPAPPVSSRPPTAYVRGERAPRACPPVFRRHGDSPSRAPTVSRVPCSEVSWPSSQASLILFFSYLKRPVSGLLVIEHVGDLRSAKTEVPRPRASITHPGCLPPDDKLKPTPTTIKPSTREGSSSPSSSANFISNRLLLRRCSCFGSRSRRQSCAPSAALGRTSICSPCAAPQPAQAVGLWGPLPWGGTGGFAAV